MFRAFVEDLNAIVQNDPAATSRLETLLCHLPLHAVWAYRVSHLARERWRIPLLPRLLSALARFWTGVEIHPGARIGRAFFIDHGAGVVIGETAEIGDHCVMFHNVTLGGTGKHAQRRVAEAQAQLVVVALLGIGLLVRPGPGGAKPLCAPPNRRH